MPRVALLALAVGLVLADSSIVTLGLPDVLVELEATPQGVSWVLTSYNLVLAAGALPAALLIGRSRPGAVAAAGLGVFAAASLACAVAGSLGVLVAARCVQGLGGAAVACAGLVLLERAAGGRARGAAVWGTAGALGAAVGPAAGGLLTDGLDWRAIFAVQVPLALACLPAALGAARLPAGPEHPGQGTRSPDVRHLAALALLGAGLTAALFLLVLLLVAGWRLSPLQAALTVSAMPVAALLARRVRVDADSGAAAGVVLVAGGLAALGLLPRAGVAWTLAPQVLIGFGLGLAIGPVTEAALARRSPVVLHGAWTIAARHAGVVLALLVLTPLFTADLRAQEDRAKEAVLARILDSGVAPATKIDLALRLAGELDAVTSRVPDIGPTFARVSAAPAERPRLRALRDDVARELDRAAASAFERSFLVAAALALGALAPLLVPARRRTPA